MFHQVGDQSTSRRRSHPGPSVPVTTTPDFLDGLKSDDALFEGEAPEQVEDEPRRRKKRKKRPWYKKHKAATVLLILLALLLAGVAGGTLWVRSQLSAIGSLGDPFATLSNRAPYAQTTADQEPVTFLVLGSDSRIESADPSQWEVGAQRTDTIMLVQVAGDRKNVNVMSIPRDSWVPIPANQVIGQESYAKINAAYSWGGPTLLIQTVENLTGIHIDHFAIANFESFKALTDQLGGVEITLTQPLDLTGAQDAANSSNVLQPGTHRLNGEQALIYARERYTLPNGDFDRIKRQQNWMRAIMQEAISRDTLTNPVKLAGLIGTIKSTVATDEAFTASAMTKLAQSLSDVRSDDVNFFQAPTNGTGTSDDGQSIVVVDNAGLAAVSEAYKTDTVTQYVGEHQDQLNMLGNEVN